MSEWKAINPFFLTPDPDQVQRLNRCTICGKEFKDGDQICFLSSYYSSINVEKNSPAHHKCAHPNIDWFNGKLVLKEVKP